MQRAINGIQQVGIGVANAAAAFAWYKKYFHFDAIVFEDVAKATLMRRYTGGEEHQRYAVLAMNMQGGGGLEIWQYTSRTPQAPQHPVQLGDPGIFAVKLKCRDVTAVYDLFLSEKLSVSPVEKNPLGQKYFFVTDPFNNLFQLIEDDYWFQKGAPLVGGVCGAIIGVSDVDAAVTFYKNILDYSEVNYFGESTSDLAEVAGERKVEHRAFLKNVPSFSGAFSKLLGPTTLELIQTKGSKKNRIYKNRWWGDLGFMHVCFDVCAMQRHEAICEQQGQPLNVNSGKSFEMGEAAGQFAYNEDPDGTLIEYVETHKVPLLKKWGLYLNLSKRKIQKPLPKWMIQCMGLGKKELQLTASYLNCTKAQAVNGTATDANQQAPVPKMSAEMRTNRG